MGRKKPSHKYKPRKRTKRSNVSKQIHGRKREDKTSDHVDGESTEEIFDRLVASSSSVRDPYSRSNNETTEEKMDVEDVSENHSSDDEWNDHVSLKDLVIERDTSEHESVLSGRRIVDVDHFIREITDLNKHGKYCTLGSYKLVKEIRTGLVTKLKFHCDNCNNDKIISSEPLEKANELNEAFVWGSVSIGIGFSQAEEMLSIMDVPTMNPKRYRKHEMRIGKVWEERLIKKMAAHAEEEKKIAMEKGNMIEGKPYITVIGDGGWGKRSYGHGMNSSSGVGVVIGAHTKKILFLGVKNKFCYVCSKAKTHKTEVPKHECFKNYCGPSTGMETSVIVEAKSEGSRIYPPCYGEEAELKTVQR